MKKRLPYRIGFGYDLHKLTENRPLILGGVKIPHVSGLLGHSDADCLTHAIIDALLGAAGEGDIGRHFPDTDPAYKDIDSQELLLKVENKITTLGFCIANIDATIIAEEPKLSPYIEKMEEILAIALKITNHQINIKATTNEKVGPIGNNEAIASYAVCLLTNNEDSA